jgi:hypothetical protein
VGPSPDTVELGRDDVSAHLGSTSIIANSPLFPCATSANTPCRPLQLGPSDLAELRPTHPGAPATSFIGKRAPSGPHRWRPTTEMEGLLLPMKGKKIGRISSLDEIVSQPCGLCHA